LLSKCQQSYTCIVLQKNDIQSLPLLLAEQKEEHPLSLPSHLHWKEKREREKKKGL